MNPDRSTVAGNSERDRDNVSHVLHVLEQIQKVDLLLRVCLEEPRLGLHNLEPNARSFHVGHVPQNGAKLLVEIST